MATRSLDEARLATVIAEVLHRHPAGGLAVGVVRHDGLEFFTGFGVADTARGTPITQHTVFRIGSISKTFTAIAVMQLREQGLLDLDDPVGEHLRSYRLAPARTSFRPVTIRQLLTHTGGIGEVRSLSDLFRPTVGLATARERPVPPLADYYRGRLRVEVDPGTKWAYANHGFATLGQLVEDVSGEPFASYMRKHVFGPLGMDSTDFVRTDSIQDQLATGYALRRHGLKAVKDRDIAVQGAGSVFSTTADMARYAAALLGGGGSGPGHAPVLPPEMLNEMFRPQYQPDPRLPGMGLGFMRGEIGGHRTVGHDGGWPGFISVMVVAPDDDLAVLSFTNTGSVTPERVTDAILREILGTAADLPRTDVPEHPEVWGGICGWYGPDPGPLTNARVRMLTGAGVEVGIQGGHLVLRALSPVPRLRQGFRLHADDPGDPYLFRLDLTDLGRGTWPIAFSRDDGGAVTALHLAPVPMSVARRPGYRHPVRLAAAVAGVAGVAGAAAVLRAISRRR
jgi:CubicO group peptidase (beta-lactamase class C family)